MNVLFLHQNFPAQFVHVALALQKMGHRTVAITDQGNVRPDIMPTLRYKFAHAPKDAHPFAATFEGQAARAEIVGRAMLRLKQDGFSPDVVVGHSGWGETLFVKDVFPQARTIVYSEFYYTPRDGGVGFDPEISAFDMRKVFHIHAQNAGLATALVDADAGVAPTQWQRSRFPDIFREKILVRHEGVDTGMLSPDPAAAVTIDGRAYRAGEEVITFVNRNLEPYRGYHIFMRALPDILARRPAARVVIVGGDGASYQHPPPGKSWKTMFLEEVQGRLPMERVHFTGKIPFPQFVALMRLSAVHVYLTYPFVLSWSMLQAMSAGALVVASRTPPVEEIVEDGRDGLLFDFFDRDALVERVTEALARPQAFAAIRRAARETIAGRFDLATICLPAWLRLVLEGR